MGIKNTELKEQEKILLDMLANNLFGAGRTVNLNEDNLDAVWGEAYTQTVTLIAFQNCNSPILKESRFSYIGNLLSQYLADNTRINFCHVKICTMMKEAGVSCSILKGFASALYYPDPLIRSMGDVDFLVDTDDFEKAHNILIANGYEPSSKSHDIHDVYHSEMCRCEMHYQPSGIPQGKAGEQIKTLLSDLLEKSESVCTELGEITVPSAYHHGLVILLHLCHHLTGDGLGLRHLCDWAVFLNTLGEARFLETFERTLKEIGLWTFAKTITFICCKYLGLSEFNFAENADEKLADTVLLDILTGGNFGQKSADRSHESLLLSSKNADNVPMLKQLFISANRIVYNNWDVAKRFKFLLPFGWIFFGGRYILRSLLGKRPKIRPQKIAREALERNNIYSQLNLFIK